jgi:hypothetical protein
LRGALVHDCAVVAAGLGLQSLVARVVQSALPLPVVDDAGNYLGAVTQALLLQRLAAGEGGDV